jgi:hypothetical protein
VTVGITEKLAPLPEVPTGVPPLDTVYHLMLYPVEVALRLEETPQLTDEGVAVTLIGVGGGLTVIVTAVRARLAQVLYASA